MVYKVFGPDGIKNQDAKLVFTQFSPKDGVRIGIRVSKLMGGPLGTILSGLSKAGEEDSVADMEFKPEQLGKAFESLADRLDEDNVIDTIGMLLTPVLYNGQPLHWESSIFQGDPLLVLTVAAKSAGVNFSDFFNGASGVVAKLKGLGATILG